jgi:arsenate reductase
VTTIYHNPACGTSRNTLALIRNSGVEPQIVEYLKTPPSREELVVLLHLMGLTPRELLREKGTPFQELGLGDPAKTDAELLDAGPSHPDQPAHRGDAPGRETVPPVGSRPRHPARTATR